MSATAMIYEWWLRTTVSFKNELFLSLNISSDLMAVTTAAQPSLLREWIACVIKAQCFVSFLCFLNLSRHDFRVEMLTFKYVDPCLSLSLCPSDN